MVFGLKIGVEKKFMKKIFQVLGKSAFISGGIQRFDKACMARRDRGPEQFDINRIFLNATKDCVDDGAEFGALPNNLANRLEILLVCGQRPLKLIKSGVTRWAL